MPEYQNVSAWIEVDNKRLEEYNVQLTCPPDGTSTVTCWIPSETNQKFTICSRETELESTSLMRITLDGVQCGGIINIPKNGAYTAEERANGRVSRRSGCYSGSESIHHFTFGSVQLTEDEDHIANMQHLGQIELSLSEVVLGAKRDGRLKVPVLSNLKVNERAKKGFVHGIQLGEPQKAQPYSVYDSTVKSQIVKFMFLYRPIDVLRANGVAPPLVRMTPVPDDPIPNQDDCQTEDLAEDDKDAERIRALEAELELLRSRNKRKTRQRGFVVKKEIKREPRVTGIFIDLT